MKYIYILDIKFQGAIIGAYMNDDIFNEIYFSMEDAVRTGKELLTESIKRHSDFMDINYEESDINYIFTVTQISCDYHNFKDINSLEKYYYENLSNNKDNIYDYLLSLVDKVIYYFDINGNMIRTDIPVIFDGFNIRYFDYGKKYNLNNFKPGDKVIPKSQFESYNDKVYEISEVINKDTTINESDNPLYFRQGYILTDIYNDYCNKSYGLHFDEELIKISEEEYLKYYKNWDWYDSNENDWKVIGTYSDHIKGLI